jgi:beta-galactosidase
VWSLSVPRTSARRRCHPARLADASGVWYDEFSNLTEPVEVTSAEFGLPAGAAATRWVDGSRPDEATVLSRYEHPHFGRWPAVTTRPAAKGQFTYTGTVPGSSLAEAILR